MGHTCKVSCLARPAIVGYMFCCCFVFVYFNDFCQTSYVKNLPTDLRRIFRVDRTVAVDDQSEISLSIPQGALSWQPIFVVVHGCGIPVRQVATCVVLSAELIRWTQAASGAAGRTNAGLFCFVILPLRYVLILILSCL